MPRFAVMTWLVLLLATQVGCPGYEDTYSGTFREVRGPAEPGGDAIAVDFFRFGDNASAIVRVYQRDPITGDPFGAQKYCVWTDAQPFDAEKMKFRLYIHKDDRLVPRGQLFGSILSEDTFEVTLYDERDNLPVQGMEKLRLGRVNEQPDIECDTIEDMLVVADFPRERQTGAPQTMPPEAQYQIHNPVLAVAWVGVQLAGGGSALAPVNRQTSAIPLDDGFGTNFDAQRGALKNERRLAVAPPPEVVRMPSGQTRLALGHFVVVDDSEEDRPQDIQLRDWQFSWDTSTEKMVASSLRRATRPACNNRGVDHWGPALLFVEGNLMELPRGMRSQIEGMPTCEDAARCEAHFYLVDVCAEGDKVLKILMRDNLEPTPSVALFVTDEYLSATSVVLPRLNPYQSW